MRASMRAQELSMRLSQFRVANFRNVRDTGWIEVSQITAFVGQNEAGKSNIFEALCRINAFTPGDAEYNIDEDWPVDDWGNKNASAIVCEADFAITDRGEIKSLLEAIVPPPPAPPEGEAPTPAPPLPEKVVLRGARGYTGPTTFSIVEPNTLKGAKDVLHAWAVANVPKIVCIREYEMPGAQVELDQLQSRLDQQGWPKLSSQDQTILIILELAKVNLKEFIAKGATPEGRTTRSFDKRAASAYLSKQFKELWTQKKVDFDIEIDGTTLNIFARDQGVDMPVRLHRRSTGFRWHVSFAWKFTHASKGEYKNCILLLEEPGIHLHFEGQRDVMKVFERLSAENTIMYTTHLSSMVNLGFPERVRIVEVRDHHTKVIRGVVSGQRAPMAVIETSLGLTGELSGLLGNRKVLIVEGGDDALVLHKLSGVMRNSSSPYLSDQIYMWPAKGASKTPMYAAFAIGQKWDAAVLLDTDEAGKDAATKINELYIKPLAEAEQKKFRVLMLGDTAGITRTDVAIEDLFPEQFYLDCANEAFGLGIAMADLPVDGSTMITKRIEYVLQKRYGRDELDKESVVKVMLRKFDGWNNIKDLPTGVAERSDRLFTKINRVFGLG